MAHLFTREEIQKVQDKEGCTWQEAQRIMAWKKGLITVWDEDLKPGTLFVKKEDPRCQVIFLKKTKDNLPLCLSRWKKSKSTLGRSEKNQHHSDRSLAHLLQTLGAYLPL